MSPREHHQEARPEGRETWEDPRDLRPHPDNPNERHDVEGLARSIDELGFGDPLVVNAEGVILCGHGRWKAALQNEWRWVPVVRKRDLTPEQEIEFLLADNEVASHSRRNPDGVAALLRRLESTGRSIAQLQVTGYRADTIQSLLGLTKGNPHGAPAADDDPGPPPADPRSQLGEVYELGPHRLVCGDSTLPETWEALFAGDEARAAGICTDPPYGIAYSSSWGSVKKDEIANDETVDAAVDVFKRALVLSIARCSDGATGMVFCGGGGKRNAIGPFWDGINSVPGATVTNFVIWDKNNCRGMNWRFRFAWEGIFEVLVGEKFAYWGGSRRQGNVLHYDRVVPMAGDHPTPKPVPLLNEILSCTIPPGGIVIDPFAGSGSLLVSAARMGRVARLVEMSPGYCDLIRNRWDRLQGADTPKAKQSKWRRG